MKNKIITTILAAAAIFVSAPAADAQRHHRHHSYHHGHHSNYVFVSGYHRCGTPIYSERYIVRYDRRSRPVYGYRVIRHRPHYVRPAPYGYYVAPAPCPPPRRSGGYISIRF
jgi:hypothetical protein